MLKYYDIEIGRWVVVPSSVDDSEIIILREMITALQIDKADAVDLELLTKTVNALEDQMAGTISESELKELESDLNGKIEDLNFLIKDLVTQEQFKELVEKVEELSNKLGEQSEVILEIEAIQIKVAELEENLRKLELEVDGLGDQIDNFEVDFKLISEEVALILEQDYVERTVFNDRMRDIQQQIDDLLTGGGPGGGGVSQEELERAINALQEEMNREMDELKKSVSDGKKQVAGSITQKGVATDPQAPFHVMAQNILRIDGEGGGGGGGDFVTFLPPKPLTKKIPLIELYTIQHEDLDTLELQTVLGEIDFYKISKEELGEEKEEDINDN